MALVKHNNNSISAVTSMASLSTGSMTLIKEVTASSDASISFVDGSSDVVLDSTYPIYKFEFINIHPATNTVYFQFNFSSDAGSNYNVTKTTTFFRARHQENDGGNALEYRTVDDLAQSTSDQRLNVRLGNGNDESFCGEMFLFNPSSTTFVKHFITKSNEYGDNDQSDNHFVAGYGNTTSAIDGVRFSMSSGNIDAGTIKLYGIKDS
jgi:hypothetical protein